MGINVELINPPVQANFSFRHTNSTYLFSFLCSNQKIAYRCQALGDIPVEMERGHQLLGASDPFRNKKNAGRFDGVPVDVYE